ncbi:hypothetical protein DL96DRAFT_1613474 [Flagelloscypha sp. PMI_526]|nr:hypothetical protein DL96DRAFT_1613474 [Flagelloscypha sp. PMI_526]
MSCPVQELAQRLTFEWALLLPACQDIKTLVILFNRISIISQGNSLREPDEVLFENLTQVFEDLSPHFSILHDVHPDAPDATQVFFAVVMGAILKVAEKDGGLECLTLVFGSIHRLTGRIRTLPLGNRVPTSDLLDLFLAVLDLVSGTVPSADCPLGFGKPLNPNEVIHKDEVKQKLCSIEDLVNIVASSPASA